MDSRPIQVIPPGLLGFFQLKNTGRNPDTMPGALDLSFDVRDWYFEARLEDAGAQGTVAKATGQSGMFGFTTNPIIVPQDEAWWVRSYTVDTPALAAGDNVTFAPAYQSGIAGTYHALPSSPSFASVSGVNTRGIVTAEGFFLGPGMELGVYILGITAAATITFQGRVRVARLPL